jgi:hypothetical protein
VSSDLHTAEELLKGAELGHLEMLSDLADGGAGDALAYRWLCIAEDFGHHKARVRIEDLLECSSLRYDDDQRELGRIHFELGYAYLRGEEGLASSRAIAQQHLTHASAMPFVDMFAGVVKTARAKLEPSERSHFDRALGANSSPKKSDLPWSLRELLDKIRIAGTYEVIAIDPERPGIKIPEAQGHSIKFLSQDEMDQLRPFLKE